MHLLFPPIASIFSVFSLICLKRSNSVSQEGAGIHSVTQIFLVNQSAAFVFSFIWFFGEGVPPVALLWQPLLVAITTMTGMGFMILAIGDGDVSPDLLDDRFVIFAHDSLDAVVKAAALDDIALAGARDRLDVDKHVPVRSHDRMFWRCRAGQHCLRATWSLGRHPGVASRQTLGRPRGETE